VKLRSLLGTIRSLEEDVRLLRAAAKEHKRSAYIVALQDVRGMPCASVRLLPAALHNPRVRCAAGARA
jgi:hypothetical protein